MTRPGPRVVVFGVLGGLLTAVAATLVFAPALLLEAAPVETAVRALAGTDPGTVALWTVAAVGVALAILAWNPSRSVAGGEAETAFERALDAPPEAVTDDRRRLAAADLDAEMTRAVVEGGERFVEVRESLFETAVRAYAEYERVDPETRSYAAVAGGEWTDDRTAAAFLAEDGPTPTVRARVRLWLTPERERRRRLDRTLAAIERLGEAEP